MTVLHSMNLPGWEIALMEVGLFGLISYLIRDNIQNLQAMHPLMYYWYCFTTLTGFWECVYIRDYKTIVQYAGTLVETGRSVWTMKFPVYYVCPVLFSKIFYAEYGAHADREYMSTRKYDYLSRLVESSHMLFCAIFTFSALVGYTLGLEKACIIGAMGISAQFMNSLLYMGYYFMECADSNCPNFNSPSFPLGKWMYKRLFMWINIFWLVFPIMISYIILVN